MNNKTPFTLNIIKPDPALEPLKVILPADGHLGFVIGEDWEVTALYELLGAYLKSGKHGGEISEMHEQMVWRWMTVREAEKFAENAGKSVSTRTIRWAASHGFIRHAQKTGRDWRFPQATFLYWLNHRPKPGRK